jgi:hypothetical protein
MKVKQTALGTSTLTSADAPNTPTLVNSYEADYEAAVEEGKAIVVAISGKHDLADKVVTKYGENRLAQFAEDINFDGAASTLERYRDVCRAFPEGRVRPRYFAVAQILATHPKRWEIVERDPDISKAKALELMRRWEEVEEQVEELLDSSNVVANLMIEATETRKKFQPEQRPLLGKAAAMTPESLETMQKAGEAWLEHVAWLRKRQQKPKKLKLCMGRIPMIKSEEAALAFRIIHSITHTSRVIIDHLCNDPPPMSKDTPGEQEQADDGWSQVLRWDDTRKALKEVRELLEQLDKLESTEPEAA